MRILIDQERCAGHGRCYTLVPSLYDSDEQGHSVALLDGPLTDEQLAQANTAVLNCPEQAISLVAD
jgi:ferredoxin